MRWLGIVWWTCELVDFLDHFVLCAYFHLAEMRLQLGKHFSRSASDRDLRAAGTLRPAPPARIATSTPVTLWAERLFITTTPSPRPLARLAHSHVIRRFSTKPATLKERHTGLAPIVGGRVGCSVVSAQ